MAGPYILLVTPTVHETTLIITGLSAYYVFQQKTKSYPYVKNLLFLIHVLFMGVVLMEFLRDFIVTPFFMEVYTIFGSSFIFWAVALAVTTSYVVYFRPPSGGIRQILASILSRPSYGILYLGFISYIALIDLYLVVASPYSIVQLTDLLGAKVTSTAFNPIFLVMMLAVLVGFMALPTTIMVAAARSSRDPSVRRAMVFLPVSWSCIGIELLVFNGYLVERGIDASAFGYLIAAGAFVGSAAIFRRATVLAGFFEHVPVTSVVARPQAEAFASSLGLERAAALGKSYLLEVDPAARYETVLKNFALELISGNHPVFAFTSRGSPVYSGLEAIPEAKFYLLTSRVSYPKPTEKPSEILVPMNDLAVLLDVLDKTVTANEETKVGIIFDSISDLVVSVGFESTFKFMKQANEILASGSATSMFLVTAGAHDDRVERLIKNLFVVQLAYNSSGLKVERAA